MKILDVRNLQVPDVKVVTIKRFRDDRGYFSEVFKQEVATTHPQLEVLHGKQFVQTNESASTPGVIRGFHTQSNDNLDKLLRVIQGRVIDCALDIRPNSPTFGQVAAIELAYDIAADVEEIVCIPFGFAHAVIMLEESRIQYFQTGTWNPAGEAAIFVKDPAINWSGIESQLAEKIHHNLETAFLSPKDAAGFTLEQWKSNELAKNY